MVLSLAESVGELWDAWNIRGPLILVVLLYSSLSLFAPSRKIQGRKWGICLRLLNWSAYVLLDWVAINILKSIIFSTERSEILTLWASFLLLCLGFPYSISSYSVEDNELWKRSLLQFLVCVGSIVCVFYLSLADNKLWLPTLLVLIAGTIKYAERIRAFYLASFENWRQRSFDSPYSQSRFIWAAFNLFGTIKHPLLGTTMSLTERVDVLSSLLGFNSEDTLLVLQINQSLLYEFLYTKLPVVNCRIGYLCLIVKICSLVGALFSFLSLRKQCNLEGFDISLTYGLLIHALIWEVTDINFLFSTDWFDITRGGVTNDFIHKLRWSNSISQLSFFTYLVKDYPVWLNNLLDFLGVKSLFQPLRGFLCLSSEDFRAHQAWGFLFQEVQENIDPGIERQTSSHRCVQILNDVHLARSINEREYMKTVLIWLIATEICCISQNVLLERVGYHRQICTLLSRYMCYLVVMEPSVMTTVSADWKTEFERTWDDAKRILGDISEERDFSRDDVLSRAEENDSTLSNAFSLAIGLNDHPGGCPWELMSKVWVEFLCVAAIRCKPNIHARLLGRGGELLTLVWLLTYYKGFSPSTAW